MARYEKIKGISVVALAEGKKLGSVEDLILDADQQQVRWLRLGSGSLFGGGDRLYVPVSAVTGVGEDAITIRSEADVQRGKDVPDLGQAESDRRMVSGNKVLTEKGKFLGTVKDYEFAPDSFALTGLVLGGGGPLSNREISVPADRIRTIGPDVLIVSDDVEPYVESQTGDMELPHTPARASSNSGRQSEPRGAGFVEPLPDDAGERSRRAADPRDVPAGFRAEETRTGAVRRNDEFIERPDIDPRDPRSGSGGAQTFDRDER